VVESGGLILRTLVRNEFCVSLMETPGCVDTMTNDPKNLIAPAPAIHAPSTPQSDADWERMAAQLLELLILHDQHSARALVIDAADNGVPFTEIYLKLIQPVMYRIGELWECRSLDVAQEHYATAVIEMILAHLEPEIFHGHNGRPAMIAAAVEGDLHVVGVRMVADFFEADGWDTCYLGANVPSTAIIAESLRRKAKLIALSASREANLPTVTQTIAAIHESAALEGILVIVGGGLFKARLHAADGIGADGSAADARIAVEVARELMQAREGKQSQ
jgi:MerR family transcriptional regulator, light-induced transcriptional regulator